MLPKYEYAKIQRETLLGMQQQLFVLILICYIIHTVKYISLSFLILFILCVRCM